MQLKNQRSRENCVRLYSIHVSFLRCFSLSRFVSGFSWEKPLLNITYDRERIFPHTVHSHLWLQQGYVYPVLNKFDYLIWSSTKFKLGSFWQISRGKQVNKWIFQDQILIIFLLTYPMLKFLSFLKKWRHGFGRFARNYTETVLSHKISTTGN